MPALHLTQQEPKSHKPHRDSGMAASRATLRSGLLSRCFLTISWSPGLRCIISLNGHRKWQGELYSVVTHRH